MKKLIYLMIAFAAFSFSACDSDKDDGNNDIKITDGDTSQSKYADEITDDAAFSFTTTAAWTSAITKSTPTREEVSWLSIYPSSGDAAGDYSISLTMENNYTGEDRTADITIFCGSSKITFKVTQKGVKEDGKVPEIPRLITSIKESASFKSDYYNKERPYNAYSYHFSYDPAYRLKEYVVKNGDGSQFDKIVYSYDIFNEVRFSNNNNSSWHRVMLDDKGRASKWIYESDDAEENFEVICEYDSDGYIKKAYRIDSPEDYSYWTWNNGNVEKINNIYTDEDNVKQDLLLNDFKFSDILNDKTNLDLNIFFFGMATSDHLFEYPRTDIEECVGMIGLTGKRSKNLVISVINNDEHYISSNICSENAIPEKGTFLYSNYDRELSGEVKYSLDAQGYPIRLVYDAKVTKNSFYYNGIPTLIHSEGDTKYYRLGEYKESEEKYDTYTYTISYNK